MFGSDPEFMLEKNGRFFSAIPIVPGTKVKRYPLGRHHCYYDNVMAECAVAPATSPEGFVENFRDCLKRYAEQVQPYTLVPQASADFPAEELTSPESQEIGCDPEYCAYALQVAEAPQEQFKSGTLRTAGGHIHLGTHIAVEGYEGSTFNLLAIVRLCDLFLGTTSIFLDKDPTTQRRKQLYGRAGRFRQPPHGVEYRSLGNYWLTSPKLVILTLEICAFVVDFVESHRWEELWRIDYEKLNADESWDDPNFHPSQCHHCIGYDAAGLREAIDTMDQKKGADFLQLLHKYLPSGICKRIAALSEQGPYDFYKEWGLK